MKTRFLAVACLNLGLAIVSPASTPSMEQYAKDRFAIVLQRIEEDPSLSQEALAVLRTVAEGHAEAVPSETAAKLGLGPEELQYAPYRSNEFRAVAYRAIGDLGTTAAVAYLEAVRAEDFEAEQDRRQLWSAAQIALQGARLSQIPDRQGKAQFLETTIRDFRDVPGNGILADWAAEELCDKGMLSSYSIAESLILDRYSGTTGRETARFCELRMRTLAGNPDRIEALGSVLQVTRGLADGQLTQWAISELTEMKSSRADEIMDRFEQQILALPADSPQRRELMPYADAVRNRQGGQPRPR